MSSLPWLKDSGGGSGLGGFLGGGVSGLLGGGASSKAISKQDIYNSSPFQVGSCSLEASGSKQSDGSFPAAENLWPAVAVVGAVLLAVTMVKG